MIDQKQLLQIFFPKEIDWERYDLIKVNVIDDKSLDPYIWRFEFIIQEKNIVPSKTILNWAQYLSKWFCPPKVISDFPVRDRYAQLIIIRRRWINKDTKEYLENDLDIVFKWTKTVFTLLDFLKQDSR